VIVGGMENALLKVNKKEEGTIGRQRKKLWAWESGGDASSVSSFRGKAVGGHWGKTCKDESEWLKQAGGGENFR